MAKLKETRNIDISLRSGFMGLKKINVADKALDVAVVLSGTANVTIDSLAAAR